MLFVVDQAPARRRDDSDGFWIPFVVDEQPVELRSRKVDLIGIDDELANPGEGALLDERNGGVLPKLAETLEEGRGSPRVDPQRQRRDHQRHDDRRDEEGSEQPQWADSR